MIRLGITRTLCAHWLKGRSSRSGATGALKNADHRLFEFRIARITGESVGVSVGTTLVGGVPSVVLAVTSALVATLVLLPVVGVADEAVAAPRDGVFAESRAAVPVGQTLIVSVAVIGLAVARAGGAPRLPLALLEPVGVRIRGATRGTCQK